MKITIINGTNRTGNKSLLISQAASEEAKKAGLDATLITLDNFNRLFQGTYIKMENATSAQKDDLQAMNNADILLFVVPTYHSGMPSSLKNFLDSIKGKEFFDKKVIAFIAGSDKNQDLGARQAAQVVNGIISYLKLHSFVISRITILDFDYIDTKRLKDFIVYLTEFLLPPQKNDLFFNFTS